MTHLSTDWFLDPSWHLWFQVWSLFTSLQSLELRPFLYLDPISEDELLAKALKNLDTLVPSSFIFPSVRSLTIKVCFFDNIARTVLTRGLAARILNLFPNLSSLRLIHLWDPFLSPENISGTSSILQKVTSLSCLKYCDYLDLDYGSLLSLPLHLTRFEFSLPQIDSSRSNFERICVKFSPTLEVVGITQVLNRANFSELWEPFRFPVMPRLKALKIFYILEGHLNDRFLPRKYFLFQTGRPSLGQVIDYTTQFPRLTQLLVRNVPSKYLFGTVLGDDDYFFDVGVKLLFNLIPLVSRGQGACVSVRVLDIPCPAGERLKYFLGVECSSHVMIEDEPQCNCWEWVESSRFFSRVADMFPNAVMRNSELNSRLEEASREI